MRTDLPARKLRLLVVDDEELVRGYVSRVLRELPYELHVAESGPQALAVFEAHRPFDLLLTDLMMPEMTGDALARHLRAIDTSLKVLYMTGYSDQLFVDRVMLPVDEAFIDKPVSVKGLREAVSLALFGHTKGPDSKDRQTEAVLCN